MEELAASIPYGLEIVAVLVAVAGLVSAIVPDNKLPKPVAAVLNFIALNFGNAKNDRAQAHRPEIQVPQP